MPKSAPTNDGSAGASNVDSAMEQEMMMPGAEVLLKALEDEGVKK